MKKFVVVAVLTGSLCAAGLPAHAQTGHIDPRVGQSDELVTTVQFRGGQRFRHGGGFHRGGYRYGYGYRHGRGAAIGAGVAGLAAGALIGGAIASQAAPVYAAPPPYADETGYCVQRFKSYDPASGTYLGYDGLRHPCP